MFPASGSCAGQAYSQRSGSIIIYIIICSGVQTVFDRDALYDTGLSVSTENKGKSHSKFPHCGARGPSGDDAAERILREFEFQSGNS